MLLLLPQGLLRPEDEEAQAAQDLRHGLEYDKGVN